MTVLYLRVTSLSSHIKSEKWHREGPSFVSFCILHAVNSWNPQWVWIKISNLVTDVSSDWQLGRRLKSNLMRITYRCDTNKCKAKSFSKSKLVLVFKILKTFQVCKTTSTGLVFYLAICWESNQYFGRNSLFKLSAFAFSVHKVKKYLYKFAALNWPHL